MNYELIKPINEDYTTIQQILTNRGIKLEDIDHYLNVSNADNLSPLLLKNMEDAAKMLIKHLDKQDNIIKIQVDADCDGMTSSSLFMNYIHARFPSLIGKFVYSFHREKIHGIDMDSIPDNTTLVIVPDAGSNEYDKHRELANRGIDVLVLDHHQTEYESKYACVVNNQMCDYPTKSLSGAGIVYKFCQYLDSLFGDNLVENYIDIAMTGIVGDMMDMRDFETHYLTQLGIANFRNPLIKGLANKDKRESKKIQSPINVAFAIVPLINAITRVGTMEEKELIFDAMLEWKAFDLVDSIKRGHKPGDQETIIEQALRVCTNVKSRQDKLRDKEAERIERIIKRDNLLDYKVLLIKLTKEETIDQGLRGLVANQLMAKYKRPTAILTESEYNGQKAWIGSSRGYEKSKLTDFRQFCLDSKLVIDAQGHPNASGLSIYDKDMENFIAYSEEALKDIEFSPNYKVDYIWNQSNIDKKAIIEIGGSKFLWGQNIDEPLVVVENLTITKDMLHLMSRDKNPTLKISLPNGVNFMKFKSSDEEFDSLFSESGCVVITVIGRCERNVYYNSITPQIIIENYEIVTKQDFYF